MRDKIHLRGKACQCTACGEIFTTESGFNAHRFGSYVDGRRCKTPEELALAGWSKRRPTNTHWMMPGRGTP